LKVFTEFIIGLKLEVPYYVEFIKISHLYFNAVEIDGLAEHDGYLFYDFR